MAQEFTVGFTTTAFNEHYTPAQGSRLTTNFANLARGERRQENLRAALTMIDRRVNTLVPWDNPTQDRYAVELEIVSAHLQRAGQAAAEPFPLLEMLQTRILDRATGTHHPGIVGNNFSSYVRDYDFSVRLPSLRGEDGAPRIPEDFGDLHGGLFQRVLASEAYRARFARPPVICISVSTSRTYRRTANVHPVLGVEYEQGEGSLTDAYFAKMGLRVRYFMPPGSVAPLAFYSCGDLLGDHSLLALAGTVSTMETFQKIYRPEIYNANAAAGLEYRPSLGALDYSRTEIDYDREERNRLGATQGQYALEHLITPHHDALRRWVAQDSAAVA